MIIIVECRDGRVLDLDVTDVPVSQVEYLAELNHWNIIEYKKKEAKDE